MKVLFVQDVPGRADAGEIKEVKNGYARNYLIPNKIAVPATEVQLQRINIIKNQAEERRIKEAQDMQLIADKLNGNEITITAKVGPNGKLYGSITNRNIAENLGALVEFPFDHRSVLIAESIQSPGTYETTIRLHRDVSAVVNVNVVGEQDETLAEIQQPNETPIPETPSDTLDATPSDTPNETPIPETPSDTPDETPIAETPSDTLDATPSEDPLRE